MSRSRKLGNKVLHANEGERPRFHLSQRCRWRVREAYRIPPPQAAAKSALRKLMHSQVQAWLATDRRA